MSEQRSKDGCDVCGMWDTHASNCSTITNWWVVQELQTLHCDFCGMELVWEDRYRFIPSLPEDDPNFAFEDVGGHYMRFSKVSCGNCSELRLVALEEGKEQPRKAIERLEI